MLNSVTFSWQKGDADYSISTSTQNVTETIQQTPIFNTLTRVYHSMSGLLGSRDNRQD